MKRNFGGCGEHGNRHVFCLTNPVVGASGCLRATYLYLVLPNMMMRGEEAGEGVKEWAKKNSSDI
jgi:hypothetical protein